jgi:hypothetical protein
MVKVSYKISLLARKKDYSTAGDSVKPCLKIFAKTVGDPNILGMVDDITVFRSAAIRRIRENGRRCG